MIICKEIIVREIFYTLTLWFAKYSLLLFFRESVITVLSYYILLFSELPGFFLVPASDGIELYTCQNMAFSWNVAASGF